MLFFGIDPGVSGGIAVISDLSIGRFVEAVKMPNTTEGIVSQIKAMHDSGIDTLAVVEKVWGFPPRTIPVSCPKCHRTIFVNAARDGSKQITTFMKNAGIIEGVLATLYIKTLFISPQRWERDMGVFGMTKAIAKTKSQKKNIHKEQAKKLFPDQKVTLATCDALLLAEYCRRLKGRFV